MDAQQRNRLDALKSSSVFVSVTPLPTPLQNPSTGLSDQIAGLNASITDADTQATSQTSGTVQQAVDQRNALRDTLRTAHLEPILHVARVLEKSNPGLPKLINLRASRTAQQLLNTCQAVLRDLTPYKDLFIAQGLPADFLDELQAAVTAFSTASNAARETKVAKVQSRAGIDTALKKGDNYKKVIGAIIRRAAPSDPNGQTFLRGWIAASHVKRSNSSSTSTTTTASVASTSSTEAASKTVTQTSATATSNKTATTAVSPSALPSAL